MASIFVSALSLVILIMAILAILTYIFRCIILVRHYIRSVHRGDVMLLFLYTLLAIFTGIVAVYLAKCEYEAITKQ